MSRSRSEIPEATVWVDVDATDLWDLRSRMRLGDRHPSLLSFIARFTLSALARYPVLAGRVTADAASIDEFDGVNLGFAVDTPRGLVVPVVRHAEPLTLRELDGEFDRLTRTARDGTAAPAELAGSTFTINNYGSLGVDGSAAIINHPEVAILGVGRFIERPWVVDGIDRAAPHRPALARLRPPGVRRRGRRGDAPGGRRLDRASVRPARRRPPA